MAAAKTSPVKKKLPVKKKATSTPSKTTVKKAETMRSFHRAPSDKEFFTFRITNQTLYWSIFSIVVLAFGIWIIQLQIEIQGLYDAIELNNMQLEMLESELPKKQS